MSELCIQPIVEGHGEERAIRVLLERTWLEIVGGQSIEILRPIRWPRTKLVKEEELRRVLGLAALKLAANGRSVARMILLLVDADEDRPCELGPRLQKWAQIHRTDQDVACVVANVEYETWFAASAPSLTRFLEGAPGDLEVLNPEERKAGKAWIQRRFKGPGYGETVDQPALTKAMDLDMCRQRSPSFDKLCRELESRHRSLQIPIQE